MTENEEAPIASFDAGVLKTQEWIKGDAYKASNACELKDVAAGTYQLCISLIDPKDGKSINLPLRDRRADGSYPVGMIRCR
jgi:hypothetical protein